MCVNLNSMAHLIDRKRCKFIDSLMGDVCFYPRRARSALGVDTVLTLDVCLYVCMLVL